MAVTPHSPQNPNFRNKRFHWILLVVLLVLTVGVLYLLMHMGKLPFGPAPPSADQPKSTASGPEAVVPEQVRRPIPPPEPPPQPTQSAPVLSAPSYPDVPPQASQDERKNAFGLKSSVDHVVQAHEPFTAHGRQWTIEEIRRRLAGREPQGLPETVKGETTGGLARKFSSGKSTEAAPKRPTVYYGVRSVRPGENLWVIHEGIVREYFARRGIELPPRADQPQPGGRSSGIGRILKFLESVVYVYSVRENRLVEDLDFLHPNDLIVFFKISEVFEGLDQISPEDLNALRYVGPTLRIMAPSKSRVLLDQRDLKDQPPPVVPNTRP